MTSTADPIYLKNRRLPMVKSNASKFFYGWVVVAACFVVTYISYGIQYSFGVFFKPILEEFGWTRVMISGVFSVYMVVHGGSAVAAGGLTDKYGPKIIVSIGGLLMGLSLVVSSQVEQIWQLYLSYGVFFGIGMGVAFVPLQSTVSRWFTARRGLAMGIVAAGAGIGTLTFTPLTAHLISLWNWRNSYIVFGVLTGIIVVCSAFILRRSPQDMGLLPNGDTTQNIAVKTSKKNTQSLEEEFTLRQAFTTIPFWMLIVIFALLSIPLGMIMVHLVPYSTDLGMDKTISAVFLGVLGGCSVPGRLIMGVISDKIGGKKALLICIVGQLLCMFWLQVAKCPWMVYVFAVFFGFSYGGWVTVLPFLAGEIFGSRALGLIIGLIIFAATFGGALGPVFAGYIYDVSSDYKTAFIGGAIITVIAFLLALFIKAPAKKIC